MAYRSRPRPSSTLGAKASTMCPYYLDGDLATPSEVAGDTRCHPRVSNAGGCGYCAVFKGRREGDACEPAARWPTAGTRPVSQNSTACTGSSSTVCRAGPARFGRRARPIGRSRVAHAQGTSPERRRTARFQSGTSLVLPRKEVIQPHLPVRLPCYDFTPVTSPTFDGSLPKGLGHRLRVLLTPVV